MSGGPGSGGLVVPKEMQRLIDKPGFLSVPQGGQRLRVLYRESSIKFNPSLLSDFAMMIFIGALEPIKEAVEQGKAPDLSGTETGYKYGYAAMSIFGAQRLANDPRCDHVGTLKHLLERSAPPDVPDVVGYTALHHACMGHPRADMARILLEHGADPNKQDRFGSVPLIGAFQNESMDAIEVLMEHGARLDIPDADGYTPDSFFIRCGPRVTAVVQKWKRKRAGESKPLDEKVCVVCGKGDGPLKWCAKCHKIWYCSKECQRSDWPVHKKTCVSHDTASTVTLKPVYDDGVTNLVPLADLSRSVLGHPVQKPPARNARGSHVPRIPPGQTKSMIIKVQVPLMPGFDEFMVYDKKRDFVCRIKKQDNPEAYRRVEQVVRSQGVGGAKAYFSAEMKKPDELIVKVSEVLPEQTF
ncbi:hypothetical protein ONZ51_g3596 [Trametes cubensis]|uniref:MYND-type domain-containing protein n=1 Tax=Trametes cubensis TaxID=1111947 RepID=A0AAD7TXJ2_9APHY|nr:hypothetical protein ONZ51_g3596 [Trametes cubensis]